MPKSKVKAAVEPKKSAMTGLLAQSPKTPKVGEIVSGKVLEVGRSKVFIDLGAAGTGVLLGREVKENRALIKSLKPGDAISAMALELENENGFIELSLQAAHREQSWDVLRKMFASQEIVKAKVTAANRAGPMA